MDFAFLSCQKKNQPYNKDSFDLKIATTLLKEVIHDR